MLYITICRMKSKTILTEAGRTARAGKSRNIYRTGEYPWKDKIRQIEKKKINRKFHLSKVPDAGDIGEQKLMHFVKKIHDAQVNEKVIDKFIGASICWTWRFEQRRYH